MEAQVKHRGYSLRLQRVLTDFGSEVSFGQRRNGVMVMACHRAVCRTGRPDRRAWRGRWRAMDRGQVSGKLWRARPLPAGLLPRQRILGGGSHSHQTPEPETLETTPARTIVGEQSGGRITRVATTPGRRDRQGTTRQRRLPVSAQTA